MTIVDLGAGTGYFLSHLSEAVGADGRVIALDVEEKMVSYMRQRLSGEGIHNVAVRQVPYDDPELDAASADRLLVVNVWHHIDDRAQYAAKILAGLKPGGRLYVVDFEKDSPHGPPAKHRLEPQQVADEIGAGGFQTEILSETLPHQYVIVGRNSAH